MTRAKTYECTVLHWSNLTRILSRTCTLHDLLAASFASQLTACFRLALFPALPLAGITSYQCMEATPSLACANKCVFCWRHHKNPVGREWRWREDPPELIVSEAIDLHVRMVNEFKGAFVVAGQ